jgi:flagellar basal body-associated protein FliL
MIDIIIIIIIIVVIVMLIMHIGPSYFRFSNYYWEEREREEIWGGVVRETTVLEVGVIET